jgi:hypothetical protein
VSVDGNLAEAATKPTYLLNDRGTQGFLQVAPVIDKQDFNGATAAIRRLRETIREVKLDHPLVKIGLTGIPVLEHDEMTRSQSDMTLATIVSAVGVLLLLLAAASGWWWWREQSPERQVRQRLVRLAELASKRRGEGGATLAAKSQMLSGLFAERVELAGDLSYLSGTFAGEELASTIINARLQLEWLDLAFSDVRVNCPQRDAAVAAFTARVQAAAKGERHHAEEETRAVTARLKRDPQGTWVFTEFRLAPSPKER